MVSKQLGYNSVDIKKAARFSVAPMMDWTDRHCRYFHRKFTKKLQKTTENYKNSLVSIQYKCFENKIFKNKNSNC